MRSQDEDMTEARFTPRSAGLLHPHLIAPGAALLIAAFVTDLFYSNTGSYLWETFSIWLLTGGLILAGLATVAFVVDMALQRAAAVAWPRFVVLAAAALLSLLNAFVHSRDGAAAVLPSGIWLSGASAVLLIVFGLGGWSLAARSVSKPSSGARS
jgi:uncharacterized membrane protein